MKVSELIATKDYKTEKIQNHAAKKKRKRNVVGDTKPHTSNVDTEYGMSGSSDAAVIRI